MAVAVLLTVAVGAGTVLGSSVVREQRPAEPSALQTAIKRAPIAFQDVLKGIKGTPVADGVQAVTFSIYSVAEGGKPLWQEFQKVITADGLFSTMLGMNQPLDPALFASSPETYLGVQLADEAEMAPRLRLGTVPYAMNAENLGGLAPAPTEEPRIIFDVCKDFLKENMILGSDPGVCVSAGASVSGEVIAFGKKAQSHVLDVEQAQRVAAAEGALMEALGPKGQGTIGAVAAVGLRGSGDDGRFIELRGIRQVSGVLSVREIKEKTDLAHVRSSDMVELADDSTVDTQDWLRPRLIGHQAVLVVEPHPELTGGWITVDRRNRRRPKG